MIEIKDFYTHWCQPCKRVVPILETIKETYPDVVITKIDVEENVDLAKQYGIRGVPSVFFEKDGVIIDKIIGGATPAEYMRMMEKVING